SLACRKGRVFPMIYRGACHCGAVRAEYETDAPVRLRHDGCSFCASRGVKSASDPNGRLMLTSTRPLVRCRFGQKTAEFLICSACGTYVGACADSEKGPIGVANVVGLQIADLKNEPAETKRLDDESVAERNARRLSRWTPMLLTEPSAKAGAH